MYKHIHLYKIVNLQTYWLKSNYLLYNQLQNLKTPTKISNTQIILYAWQSLTQITITKDNKPTALTAQSIHSFENTQSLQYMIVVKFKNYLKLLQNSQKILYYADKSFKITLKMTRPKQTIPSFTFSQRKIQNRIIVYLFFHIISYFQITFRFILNIRTSSSHFRTHLIALIIQQYKCNALEFTHPSGVFNVIILYNLILQSFSYNHRIFSKTNMTNKQNYPSINDFPSLFCSSICIDDLSLRNEVSFKLPNPPESYILGMDSFNEAILVDLQNKINCGEDKLQMQRCSSFEEILTENHKKVLIQSISEYFSKTNHQILKKLKNIQINSPSLKYHSSIDKKTEIELIIQNNYVSTQIVKNELISKLSDNVDQINIIYDVLTIYPKEIQFEVLYLIILLLTECDQIIQHFKKKTIAQQLKERSIDLSKKLRQHDCLSYLFDVDSIEKIHANFTTLIQKWMITLFLMKIGVFQNQLQSKSVEDCLRSDVFRKINVNDLLNQHLIHRIKKRKSDSKL